MKSLNKDVADLVQSPLGSASAPSISFVGDPNTGIYSPGADQVAISTGGTGRLFVDASGRVGIGTASPSQPLHIVGTTASALFEGSIQGGITIQKAGTLGINLVSDQAGTLIFYNLNGNNERARIDSSGRLLVGTASARTNFFNGSVTAGLQAEATGEGSIVAAIRNTNNQTNAPVFLLAKSRGTAVGSNTVVQSGDHLGYLSFQASDGSEFVEAARISAEVDGTPGANDMPGRLVFSTTADGASSPTERMRITSDAYVRLASGTGGIQFNGDTAAANALDDYEEGTFTPTVFGSTAGGTTTYSAQTGRYTKVGRVVHIQLFLDWTNATGTGFMRIGGLPFTAASDATYPACAIGDINNIALTANNVVLARVEPSTTNIFMAQYPVGGGASSSVGIDTAGFITLAGSYIV